MAKIYTALNKEKRICLFPNNVVDINCRNSLKKQEMCDIMEIMNKHTLGENYLCHTMKFLARY